MSAQGNDDDSGEKTRKGKDKNIIHFPALDQRNKFKKSVEDSKKLRDKEDSAARKKREKLEEDYRKQYRAERAANAMRQTQIARSSASGKASFINWEKIPLFTRCLIAAIFIIHVAVTFGLNDAQYLWFIHHFAFTPAVYTGQVEWVNSAIIAPFTSLFIHGGWMHLCVNIVMALAMGVFFERQFGAKRAAAFFILCGMAGNLAYLLINPYSIVPVIGASGGISGLFAVAILNMTEQGYMGPEAQQRGPVPFILLWTAIIVGLGLLSNDTSWQSHLGGFWSGLGFYYLSKKKTFKP